MKYGIACEGMWGHIFICFFDSIEKAKEACKYYEENNNFSPFIFQVTDTRKADISYDWNF